MWHEGKGTCNISYNKLINIFNMSPLLITYLLLYRHQASWQCLYDCQCSSEPLTPTLEPLSQWSEHSLWEEFRETYKFICKIKHINTIKNILQENNNKPNFMYSSSQWLESLQTCFIQVMSCMQAYIKTYVLAFLQQQWWLCQLSKVHML